jgi:hypothetical protein
MKMYSSREAALYESQDIWNTKGKNMNANTPNYVVLPLVATALMIFPSCSSSSKEKDVEYYDSYHGYYQPLKSGTVETTETTSVSTAEKTYNMSTGTRGAVAVDTRQVTAKVISIDSMNRHVTLATPDGRTMTIQAGPEVVNFDQIHVGDTLVATVTEEVAVYLSKYGAAPSASVSSSVALAPVGAKPGGYVAKTVDVTAKVTSVEPDNRHVTLQFPDGSTRRIKLGNEINMSNISQGDDVTVRVTEAVAIDIRKSS